jgi:hypothetical protein
MFWSKMKTFQKKLVQITVLLFLKINKKEDLFVDFLVHKEQQNK